MAGLRRRRDAGDEAEDAGDVKKNRPPNTAFRQQRMRAWQCVLTPKLIVTVFSILAAIYLGFGAYLTYLAHTVRDLTVDYTDCIQDAPESKDSWALVPRDNIKAHFSSKADPEFDPFATQWRREKRETTVQDEKQLRDYCILQIKVPEQMEAPVSFYYHLENFYQNHRRYVASFNAKQLAGEIVDINTIKDSTCHPVAVMDNKIVYPCGVVANSMFNDTFSQPLRLGAGEDGELYRMSNDTGTITWSGLQDLYGPTKYNITQIVPPPNWVKQFPNGYTNVSELPDLKNWAHFQNWMMLAASPNFYKLYQKNSNDPMKKGNYQIEIQSNFDTKKYNGRKAVVITTLSTMGSRNIWPGIIFLIVGGICLLLDVYFILSFFLWKPRKLGDPSYLSWNQPSAAQAHAGAS